MFITYLHDIHVNRSRLEFQNTVIMTTNLSTVATCMYQEGLIAFIIWSACLNISGCLTVNKLYCTRSEKLAHYSSYASNRDVTFDSKLKRNPVRDAEEKPVHKNNLGENYYRIKDLMFHNRFH